MMVESKDPLKIDLSIILPTLNEVESVTVTLSVLEELLQGVAFELIVVDDNSSDGTWQKVLEISRNDPKIRLVRRVHRKGCLLYTSPSPRDATLSRMPSSA